MLFSCGIITYFKEEATYEQENLSALKNVTICIENLIKEESDDFISYLNFYKEHCDDMEIDPNFESYLPAYNEFMKEFNTQYPGLVLGKDIMVEELPYDLQLDYYEYTHEYWATVFETVRKSMNLMYVYFVVPDETTEHVLYVIDVERSPREDDPEYMMLGDNVLNDFDKFNVEWDTWKAGEKLDDYQIFDNEWGHTYTYCNPLVIDGEKYGLIMADTQFDTVNKKILF